MCLAEKLIVSCVEHACIHYEWPSTKTLTGFRPG